MKTDVNNSKLMIELGIHPKDLEPRDESVWTKTDKERKKLKKLRTKEKIHFNSKPKSYIPLTAKLVVYLKKNKIFPNTTYSFICGPHDVIEIMDQFKQIIKGKLVNLVSKYKYNNIEYESDQKPV